MKTFKEAFHSVIVMQDRATEDPLPETVAAIEETVSRNREIIDEMRCDEEVACWLCGLNDGDVNWDRLDALLTTFGNGVLVGMQMERTE